MTGISHPSGLDKPEPDSVRDLDAMERRLLAERGRMTFQRFLFIFSLLFLLLGAFLIINPEPFTSLFMDRYDLMDWVPKHNKYTVFFRRHTNNNFDMLS